MARDGKKVVVIGAGIGGAGVAALLQRRGHQVTLLERNNYLGGKCTSFVKDGFVCDYAFHIFSMGDAGPLGEINRRVGGDLKWVKTHPLGKSYLQGGGWLTLPESPRWAIPYGGMGYIKGVIRPGVFNTLGKSLKNFGLAGLIDTAVKIARVDEGFLTTLDDISMRDFLLQFTDDKPTHRLMALFCFLAIVIPYTEGSAGELLWCLANMFGKGSVGYPQGGAREIAGAYGRAFIRDGGVLRRDCPIKRIIVKDGRAQGVETKDGEAILADVVISNAGIKTTVDLAGADQFPAEYVSFVKGLKYSRSASIIKYGLDCCLPEIPQHFFQYVSQEEPERMAGFLKTGTYPEDASFALIKPTDWDPYLAPLGKQIVLAGTIGPSEVTPENITYCEGLLDIAEKRLYDFFPRIKEHIEWKQRATIEQTSALTGRSTGECVGLAQCVGQTGAKKPKVATPIKDLWLVGSDAGARGIGTEQAAGSALYVSTMVG